MSKIETTKSESIRNLLSHTMVAGFWYDMKQMMEMTGWDSKAIRVAIRTWKRSGHIRLQGDRGTMEYRLIR